MRIFRSIGELPFRVALEPLDLGGLWFSRAPDFSRKRVGVVGSRLATEGALELAAKLAGELAHEGIDVVSGGAVGIDGAAHRGCLDAQGEGASGITWLVSPSGLGKPTPPEQKDLFLEVEREGIVVSQFEPERFPRTPNRHQLRNGVLTSLVDALVVVQAGRVSGTLNAGTQAIRRGIPCLVLAGPVNDPHYAGSRQIGAKRGALWIHSEAELWAALRLAIAGAGPEASASPALSGTARALLPLLTDEPRHVDWLAEQSSLTMAELSPVLLTLSLEDVVKEGPAGFWAIGSRTRTFT